MKTIKKMFAWVAVMVATTAQMIYRPFVAAIERRKESLINRDSVEAVTRVAIWGGLAITAIFFPGAAVALTIFKVLFWIDIVMTVVVATMITQSIFAIANFTESVWDKFKAADKAAETTETVIEVVADLAPAV